MNTVLGLDLGTQSLKAVLYNYEEKNIAAVALSPLEVDRDNQGKAEQRAENIGFLNAIFGQSAT